MSNILYKRTHKLILLLVDLVLIFGAYILAFLIRYNEIPQRNWESFLSLAPWILLISIFFLSIYELYSLSRKSIWDIVNSILVASTLMSLITMSASFLFREFALPRTVIVLAWILIIILLSIWKLLFIKLNNPKEKGTVLLIGDELETEKLITQIKHPLFSETKIKRMHVNTNLTSIFQMIGQVDYVVLCSGIRKEEKAEIIYYSIKNGKVIYVVPSLYDLLLSKAVITSLDDSMVMAVKPFGLTWDQLFLKRLVDILISAIALIILSPVFLITACLIKLEKPTGRILYTQKRVGKNNEEFTIYKFRSMIEGAEKQTGPILAEENDHRITKVGQFIRRTRVDELPQLVNVLLGDMSIVGPRPEREYFTKQYAKEHQSYQYRSTVKPGITGYAQVMGKYTTDVDDKLRFDLYYIRNYSFWLDIVIILRTILVLFDKTKSKGKSVKKQKSKELSNSISVDG